MLPKILVVGDDEAIRVVLRMHLERWGYRVSLARSGLEAQVLFQSHHPDMVISEMVMPKLSGIDLLRALKDSDRKCPVVLVTGNGSVDTVVEAMKEGARDVLTKPVDYPKLREVLKTVEREMRRRLKVQRLIAERSGLSEVVGTSKAMHRIFNLIRELARADTPVLITGESGTGKELVARAIHHSSQRSGEAFVPVNTAAIPPHLVESEVFGHERGAFTGAVSAREGYFEVAHRGTLLLDEITEMPIALQPKLLRVLEDGRIRRLGGSKELQFDVRILSTTNRDVQKAIEENNLRQDLFYRLSVFTVEIPPLRDRRSDIPLLIQCFVSEMNQRHGTEVEGVFDGVLANLVDYSWPGNVRELKNVIERAAVLARDGWIRLRHLPPYVRGTGGRSNARITLPVGISAAEAEKQVILKTLEMVRGNKAEAARWLELDVKTIRNKLKVYGHH